MKPIKKIVLLIVFFVFSIECMAIERFYFGPTPRDLEINSKEETLFIYPSPPVAQICHPSNVVQMFPVENFSEIQMLNLPQSEQNPSLGQKNTPTSNFLKIIPVQMGKAFCSVRMANGESVNVNLILSESILRPIVDFKNVNVESNDTDSFGGEGQSESIAIFKEFVAGGKLTQFKDISPGNECFDTDTGHYSVSYLGTNNRYKIWIIDSKFKKEFSSLPKLKNPKIGEIYYSTIFEDKKKKNPKKIGLEENYQIYVLTRGDFAITEMKEVLP